MGDVYDKLFLAFRDDERNWRQTVYVYRVSESGQLIKPYLFRNTGVIDSDSELFHLLRDQYGGGEFRIFIRDGSRMVFSGDIAVWGPAVRSSLAAKQQY
jgi:hypothetical protein